MMERVFHRKPPSVSAAEGARAAEQGRVVAYWRKGCPFCQRLQLSLGKKVKDVVWVDVWADPEASAYVRSVNGGDEVVPTVVIGGSPRTNPPPREVAAVL